MKLLFLGTGASEGIPNPFCKCNICEQTRQYGGRDVRSRCSVLIDDEIQIDITPDFYAQLRQHKVDATQIKDLIFTHTHADHFNVGELHNRVPNFAFNVEHTLSIYGNDKAITGCLNAIEDLSENRFKLHILVPFVPVETSTGAVITPLIANHAKWEMCYMYLIEKHGKTILYGHDSGYYGKLTWDYLKDRPLDLIVLENTYGYLNDEYTDNHMSIETVIKMKETFGKNGNLLPHTEIVTSHHSHSCGFNYEQLCEIFSPHGIEVAYDGLIKTV